MFATNYAKDKIQLYKYISNNKFDYYLFELLPLCSNRPLHCPRISKVTTIFILLQYKGFIRQVIELHTSQAKTEYLHRSRVRHRVESFLTIKGSLQGIIILTDRRRFARWVTNCSISSITITIAVTREL